MYDGIGAHITNAHAAGYEDDLEVVDDNKAADILLLPQRNFYTHLRTDSDDLTIYEALVNLSKEEDPNDIFSAGAIMTEWSEDTQSILIQQGGAFNTDYDQVCTT